MSSVTDLEANETLDDRRVRLDGHNMQDDVTKSSACERFLIFMAVLVSVILFPLTIWISFVQVQQYHRGLKFRCGRKKGQLEPGINMRIPFVDEIIRVDIRTTTYDIPAQQILTGDQVTIRVDGVLFYRVDNPMNAIVKAENFRYATELAAATSLRTALSKRTLSEILHNRDAIAAEMLQIVDRATDQWGVRVLQMEIRDVTLPDDLQRAMAAEAEAGREAAAKKISATGEYEASKMLGKAASELSASPGAMTLRYLSTLTTIAAEQNSTIVFPLPGVGGDPYESPAGRLALAAAGVEKQR
ncbi:MAG: uncharacterized protein KVP18_000574 [Porospora cf. gigantea A]|uniref:uncharacterized protein n=1 Tax=Porospora cf. gigantea A TaxID=2853593 RepID=UPI00355A3704|nr:MAG: hypothetical protein KVP18_000574 [Porospora cf. gigantea A]